MKFLFLNFFGEKAYAELYSSFQVWRLKRGKGKYWEPEINLLPHFVHPGDIVIDIGANLAQYTYFLSKLVGPSGKVFAFEPMKYTFKILQRIVKKLKLENVELKNIALGEKEGELEFILPFNNFGLKDVYTSHLYTQEENTKGTIEKVQVVTLDKFWQRFPILEKTTFLKCDVEGQELLVFKGAKTFLSQCQPVILCEIEKRYTKRYGYSPKDLFNFLRNFGYKAFVFVSNKLVPTYGIYEIFNKILNNYVFIPPNLVSKFNQE